MLVAAAVAMSRLAIVCELTDGDFVERSLGG